MTLQEHLSWLMHLMSEHPKGWKQYTWARAKELAKDPDLYELPQMLAQAMQQRSKESGPDQQCTGQTSTTPEPMQHDAQRQ